MQRLIARPPAGTAAATPDAPVTQRIIPTGQPPEPIKGPPGPEAAASALDKIRAIVGKKKGEGYTWVGPLDESELGKLWGSFGTGLADVVEANPYEWEESWKRGMVVTDLSIGSRIRYEFAGEVRSLSKKYLEKNLEDAAAREKELGFDTDKPFTADQIQKQKDLEAMAIEAQRLKKAKEQIERAAYVGWEKNPSLGDKHIGPRQLYLPVTFTPGAPPPYPASHRPGPGDLPMVAYDDVMAQWKPVAGTLLGLLDEHPALFAAEAQDKLGAVAGETKDDNPVEAARQSLADAKVAIRKTQQSPPDWHELKPIHRQLLGGEATGSMNWNRRLYKDVLKEEVGDYETLATVTDLSLGLLAAVAFLFAEGLSGGTATALLVAGLGVTAGQTAGKWNSWAELDNAADAATSSATQLVDQGQVSAALVDAVLQTAFAALDAWQAYKTGIKLAGGYLASRAGGEAAEVGLKNFTKLSEMEKLLAVDKGIQELGVEQTMARIGTKNPGDLLKALPENSASWLRVHEYLQLTFRVGNMDVSKAIGNLGRLIAEKGTAVADDVVALAVERLGPREVLARTDGWAKLASALGDGSATGKGLMSWRNGIYADLKRYVGEELGAAVEETGSLGAFTNDLDMSFMGKNASANRARALQFLGSRSGFGANAKTLDDMLYIGLFTDPRRIHMFDQYPQLAADLSKHTASFEEQLGWSAEYYRVVKDNPARAERVLKDMDEITGGTVKLIENFDELSGKSLDVLSAEQDTLVGEIEALIAKQPPDLAMAGPKMELLAMTQAQINVAEKGGYSTGGAVRRFVSEDPRNPMPDYEPGKAPLKPDTNAYTEALGQVTKLRDAVEKVKAVDLAAPGSLLELPGAVKSVGKFGDRFSQAALDVGTAATPGSKEFATMADKFEAIITKAREKGALQAAIREDADAVVAEVAAACASFDNVHNAILRGLRTQAGLVGHEVVAADIIKATLTRYKWIRTKSILMTQVGAFPRFVETLVTPRPESEARLVKPIAPGEAPYPEQPSGG